MTTIKKSVPEKIMSSKDVIVLYTALEKLGITIWVDGGWGVDALLGKQTRPHGDLDIAVQYKDLVGLRTYLESQGYSEVERDEDKKWNFVLGDENGHEVDVHAFTFNDGGHVVEGIEYPDGSLDGIGMIDGHTVRCITPKHMIIFHTRHEPRENDFKDVAALCEKFGIEYPEKYAHFKKHNKDMGTKKP